MFYFAICINVVVAGGGGGDKTDAATCWNGLAPLSMFEFAFRERERGPLFFGHHLRHKHGRNKVNMMSFSFSSPLLL